MPDLSENRNGLTCCKAKKWDDQKECTVKDAEKSRFRDCCIWISADDEQRCSNPNAGRKNNERD